MHKQILVHALGLAVAITCVAQTNSPKAAISEPVPPINGTPLTIPVFTSPTTLGDSVMKQDAAGNVGVGSSPFAGARLGVSGNVNAAGDITANNVISRGKITAGDLVGKTLSISGDAVISGSVTGAGDIIATGTLKSTTLTSNNISAGAVSAGQYKIGPNLILSAPGTNTIMGVGAGTAAGSSAGNSLFGLNAGSVNTGQNNSVFGAGANTWGMGSNNAYFGADAGFFGAGNENSYFGRGAGKATFTNNLTTLIDANTETTDGTANATAIGAHAFAKATDTLVLGSVNGTNGATSEPNVGIGTTTPQTKLEVANGDVYISLGGRGLILKSTTGLSCTYIRVNDAHQLFLSSTNCPGGITGN